MTQHWHRAIAFALTGEEIDLAPGSAPDTGALLAHLGQLGWPAERIRAHAAEATVWPHPVPDAVRAGLGVAQLHAAIGAARHRLGLDALTVLPPSRRTRLNADERRLQADVPPHY